MTINNINTDTPLADAAVEAWRRRLGLWAARNAVDILELVADFDLFDLEVSDWVCDRFDELKFQAVEPDDYGDVLACAALWHATGVNPYEVPVKLLDTAFGSAPMVATRRWTDAIRNMATYPTAPAGHTGWAQAS